MPNTALSDLLNGVLAEAADALDPACTGHDAPTRQFVAHGEPAIDLCEGGVLAVWAGLIVHTQVGDGCQVRRAAEVNVDLWRCVSTLDDDGTPPTDATLTAEADALASDAWALSCGLIANVGAVAGDCAAVEWQDGVALDPNGGMAGWRFTAVVDLTGACDECGS